MPESLYLDSSDEVRSACAEFQRVFRTPFEIREESAAGWKPIEGSTGISAESWDVDVPVWLNCQIDTLRQGKAIALKYDDANVLLAIPLAFEGPLRLAIGRVSGDPRALLDAVGDLIRTTLGNVMEISSLREMVAEYRRQVTVDLEERTYLREIARYMEHCSLSMTLKQVADEILPRLQKLAELDRLCLIVPEEDDSAGPKGPHRILSACGETGITEDECLALIRRFASADSRRPVVRSIHRCRELRDMHDSIDAIALSTLIHEGQLVGWLLAVNSHGNGENHTTTHNGHYDVRLGSVEASLLESTGILLTSHAHNRQLYTEKVELTIELVRSLVAVLDARDQYTCGHSDRVACMGRHLARSLGLPESECETIYLSGLLHDLGKIGIVDDVLLKPGRLTEEEFAQIKEHPQRGYDLLKRLKPLQEMLPGVLHHHEAWDGSGYPHGLAGEKIPLIARILAVADSFDAMTSCRPYRDGMPLEKAIGILREGAGQQWQAELIHTFLDHVDEMQAICADSRVRTDRLLCRADDSSAEHSGGAGQDELTSVFGSRRTDVG